MAIYETHSGGEYDAANVIEKPIVKGITTLGLDHTDQLGPSIEDIAWHKAGIFKSGSPAFSTSQGPAAQNVLLRRAAERNVALNFVSIDSTLPFTAPALMPEVQRINASLALSLVNCFLASHCNNELISDDAQRNLEHIVWPGKFHYIDHSNYQWFLDGAHNELSLPKSAQWFTQTASEMQKYADTYIVLKPCLHIR